LKGRGFSRAVKFGMKKTGKGTASAVPLSAL
jgi:hypothetical protein